MACRIPSVLAAPRHYRGCNPCCLRHPGLARLCDARGLAPTDRHLWLHARRHWLRAARLVAATRSGPNVCDLADDRGRSRTARRWRWSPLRANCQPCRLCGRVALPDRMAVSAQHAGTPNQRQHSRGFKAGAGLTIIMTQLPSLFGVAGGGHNFFDRAIRLVGQLGGMHCMVLAIGLVALLLLLFGERFLPGKPVGLTVVALSILVATIVGLPAMGIPVTGNIPSGLPNFAMPTFGLLEFDELFPLAAGILLLAYVEGVSAARSFAAKHGYALDVRQEFLGLGAANVAVALGQGYPVAGGLSQSAVNDQAGARSPLALVICSITLAICLLFLTGLLTNLPKAVLAAIVFTAVST